MNVIENLSFKLGEQPHAKLFTETAEGIVKEFEHDNVFNNSKKTDHIKTSQIRRFYNDLIAAKSQIELVPLADRAEAFKLQIPYVNMMLTKARYARSREVAGEKFVKFVEKCLAPLTPERPKESYEHFKVFCSLFEAVIAYSNDILGKK